jgi:hypothetical protein
VYVPTLMVKESFFLVPAVVTPIVQGNVVLKLVVDSLVPMVATPIIGSLMAETNEKEEPGFQKHISNHEEEQQQPIIQDMSRNEPPRRSQRARRSAISEDYEVYVNEEIQMEGDPTSFEKTIRSVHSSKWLKAMEDEIGSISTNRV